MERVPVFFLVTLRAAIRGFAFPSPLNVSRSPSLAQPTFLWPGSCRNRLRLVSISRRVPWPTLGHVKHSLFQKERTGHKVLSSIREFSVQFGSVVNYSVEYLPVAGGM
jgi:hypothetical protein